MKNQPVIERFIDKISNYGSKGCWTFTSSINRKGYGRFFHNGKCVDAHRVSYELFIGKIKEGFQLHHLCSNPPCVNPSHLKRVTPREHYSELTPSHIAYKNAHKTMCPKGHSLVKGNLVLFRLKMGQRTCLICARKRSRDCQRIKRASRQ